VLLLAGLAVTAMILWAAAVMVFGFELPRPK